jgi:hypothetical protein
MFVSGGTDHAVRLWDLTTGSSQVRYLHDADVNCAAFSKDGNLFATGGNDKKIFLSNLQTGETLELGGHDDAVNMVAFSPDGRILASASSDTTIKLWSVSSGTAIQTISAHTNEVECLAFSPDGQVLASGSVDTNIKLWKIAIAENRVEISLLKTLTGHLSVVQALAFSPNGDMLASGSWDHTVRLWDLTSGSSRKNWVLEGHPGKVTSLAFDPAGRVLATASADNVKLWDISSANEIASLIALDQDDAAVVAPDGHFDATQNAQKLLHYVVGVKLALDLNQLTKKYYEPGLLPKLLGYDKTPLLLNNVKPFNQVKLDMPYLNVIQPSRGGWMMKIELTNNDRGGIGQVSIFVKGILRLADARGSDFDPDQPEAILKINLQQFEQFLIPGEENRIAVKVRSKTGELSRDFEISFKPPSDTPPTAPQLWAVVVGVGKYASDKLEPLSAGTDARAIAEAFRIAGERLFPGGVHITTLSTDGEKPGEKPTKDELPTRDNILKALQRIRDDRNVKASDILLIYLAGHGVSYGGAADGDYYYLTSEASDPQLGGNDRTTIAGREIVALIKAIATAKRVLILDTCAAGRINEDVKSRGVDAVTQRAWQDMNSSAGFWLLPGSAADAASFEARDIRMGLLTLSLLRALKIDYQKALVADPRSNAHELVAVAELFNYCENTVKELAKQLGRTQDPKPLAGEGRVIIGRVTDVDRSRIPLPLKPPSYVRSNFTLEEEQDDPVHLTDRLDDRLRELSAGFNAKLFFTDASRDSESYRLTGRYTLEGGRINVRVQIRQEGATNPTASFSVAGEREKLDELVARIVDEVIQRVPKPK